MDYSGIAARFVERVSASDPFLGGFGVLPDYSLASLRAIDEFISDTFGTRGDSPDSDDYRPSQGKQNLIVEFGCYLGETVRRSLGGSWREDAKNPNNPLWTRLEFGEKDFIFPVARVFKRFKNGEEDALWVLCWTLMHDRKPEILSGQARGYIRQAEHLLKNSRLPETRRFDLAAEFFSVAGGMEPALKKAADARAAELRSKINQAELQLYLQARERVEKKEAPDFASEASVIAREAGRWRYNLDFSVASLAALDLFISGAWDASAGCIRMNLIKGWDAQEWFVGCYIGEVLVRNLGGAWKPDPNDRKKSTVVKKGGLTTSPFQWAGERARSGMNAPVYGRLSGLRSAQDATGDADWFVAQIDAPKDRQDYNARCVAFVDHAMQADGGRVGLQKKKALLLLPLHRFEEALACAEAIPAKDADTLELKGAALAGLGRVVEASEAYKEVLKLDPVRASAFCRVGEMLKKLGKIDEALVALDQAISLDRECTPAHFRRGEVLMAKGEWKEAVKAFIEVRRASGPAIMRWHQAGLCVDERAHLHPEARDNAYQAGQACSAYMLICHRIGICEDHLHELGSAASNLRSFLGSPPAGYEAEIAEAKRLVPILETLKAAWDAGNQAGDIPLFVETMKKALAMDPARLEERRQLAIGLSMIDRHEEALKELDSILAENPEFPSVLANRGTVLSKMGRLEEAVAVYDECLKREPDNRSSWINKVVCLQQLKDDKRLRAFYTETISRDETHETAWFYIGLYAKQGGRMEAAVDCFKKFLKYAKPDTPKNMIDGAKYDIQRFESGAAT